MKKIYTILFAATVAAFAMVSCQKNVQEEKVIEKETIEAPAIKFYAEEVATKTVFGTPSGTNYPTLWTETYKIKIHQNLGSPVQGTVVPTPSDNGKTATFTYTGGDNITNDGSATYVFNAVSPAVAFTSFQKSNAEDKHWVVTVAASQTPTASSVDEKVQLVVAQSSEFDSFPSSVGFSFSHITAYGKLSLVNFTPEAGETVSSISLTAPENWVGTYNWYPVAMGTHAAGEWVATSASKTITINTSATEDVWFACVPVDLGGQNVNLEVTTNKGVYSKIITFPVGKKFEAGKIASFGIDMSGVTRVEPDANSIAEIKALYSGADVAFTAKLTDALVTIVSGSNAYIQDATGGVYIYNTPSHGLSVGDKLTGIISGTITVYNGLTEIKSFSSSAMKTTGNTVTPTTVALSTLIDNFDEYESQYVKVENLTVSAVSSNTITLADTDLQIYNQSGKTIAVGTKLNAVGAPGLYNTTKQIKIYTLNDDDLLVIPAVIIAEDKEVIVGSTVEINATTNSTADIAYESADTDIAEVDANGVITGKSVGSTTITCSVPVDGKYTAASKDITVTVKASGSETVVYTLDGTVTGGSSGYATESEITQNGKSWEVMGNTTMNPWRIGGKNLSGEERTIYSTTAITENISKIVIEHGTANNITVNSMTVIVSKNDNFSSPVSTLTPSFEANNEVTVNRPDGKDWSNCYYKIVYNVTVSDSSNKFFQFKNAKFTGK